MQSLVIVSRRAPVGFWTDDETFSRVTHVRDLYISLAFQRGIKVNAFQIIYIIRQFSILLSTVAAVVHRRIGHAFKAHLMNNSLTNKEQQSQKWIESPSKSNLINFKNWYNFVHLKKNVKYKDKFLFININ